MGGWIGSPKLEMVECSTTSYMAMATEIGCGATMVRVSYQDPKGILGPVPCGRQASVGNRQSTLLGGYVDGRLPNL